MDDTYTLDKRTVALMGLQQHGYIESEVDPVLGGIITLRGELAEAVLIHHSDGIPVIGFPEAMRNVILATWIGWSLRDHQLILFGASEGSPNTFEMRTPIDTATFTELSSYIGYISIGLINVNKESNRYDVIETLCYRRLHIT